MRRIHMTLLLVVFCLVAGCRADGHGRKSFVPDRGSGEPSNDLSDLSLSAGALVPAFDPGTPTDAVTVPFTTTSTTVTPTTEDPKATVEVDGVSVTSGSPSQPAPLAVGTTTITIRVMNLVFGIASGPSAVSGGTVIVGASGEASDGTSQSDDSAFGAGAVYVFD